MVDPAKDKHQAPTNRSKLNMGPSFQVRALTRRQAINEQTIAINRDWVYNQTCRLLHDINVVCNCFYKSKQDGKDQESIQSSTTPDPGYQWESGKVTIRHHKREPRGQPFPSR